MCESIIIDVFAERRCLVTVHTVHYVRRKKNALFVTLFYAVNTELIHSFHLQNISLLEIFINSMRSM